MLNYTRIPAPRVTIVDPQTGIVSNEWFRFFNNLYTIAYAATGSVTPGTYGSATAVPQITVDDFGTITGISNVPIAIDASQIVSGTIASARISGSYTGITGVGTLTVGTWNATAITTPYGGTGLTSYTAGDTLYYASGTALTKLAIGASTFINTSSGTAPQWTDPSTITIGKATNLVGGAANRIAYQTAADTTGFIVAPTVSNTYLEWSGTAFQWSSNPLGTVTSVSVVSANGLAGTVATATTTPAITLSTTVTGLLKGNGTAISAASSGTDYAPATSGTSILYGNGAGGFSNVTIGTGVSFAGGTLSATGSGGTVTSVSGTGSVNGITLTGTITTTGSLTLGGTLSGIGNSQLTNSTISGVALGGSLFNLTAGTGVTFSTGTTYNGSAAITINATGTGGTVTSVAALTLGTTGTDLSSTVANGTTTPVITLQVPTASSVNRGALSAADWTTFNSKAPGVTFTTNYIPYGQGTTTLNQSSALQFDGSNLTLGNGYILATRGSKNLYLNPNYSNANAYSSIQADASMGLQFFVNNSATATQTITSGGLVGIGSIVSNTNNKLIIRSDSVNAISNTLMLNNGSADNQAGTGVSINMSGISEASANLRYAYIRAATATTGNDHYLAFGTNAAAAAPTEKMRIFPSGGVSIGNTTDPGATNLSVTGTGKFGTTVGVGAATPSASGAGITFPATASLSTNANTLDDYEEGTWTPSVGGTATYNLQTGAYTRIGNIVRISGTLAVNVLGTGSTTTISGLPFAATDSPAAFVGFSNFGSLALAITYIAGSATGSSTITIRSILVAGTATAVNAVIGNSTRLDFAGTYNV